MKLSLVKKADNNTPYIAANDDYAFEEMGKLANGTYMVTITKARNPKFHNKAMKFIRVLFDNQEEYDNFDNFYALVKLQLGYFDMAKSIRNGVDVPIIRSISFEAMDEIEFQVFYEKLTRFAMDQYGIDSGAVMLIESFC